MTENILLEIFPFVVGKKNQTKRNETKKSNAPRGPAHHEEQSPQHSSFGDWAHPRTCQSRSGKGCEGSFKQKETEQKGAGRQAAIHPGSPGAEWTFLL